MEKLKNIKDQYSFIGSSFFQEQEKFAEDFHVISLHDFISKQARTSGVVITGKKGDFFCPKAWMRTFL